MTKQIEKPLSFQEWMKQLNRLIKKLGAEVHGQGFGDWRNEYDRSLSPNEALEKEMSE